LKISKEMYSKFKRDSKKKFKICFERSYLQYIFHTFLATFVYSGGWIGNVICLLSTGFLSASSIGWPSCFYVWGSCSILCGISFFIFGKDSPSEHPSIPSDEKEYIEMSLGATEVDEVTCSFNVLIRNKFTSVKFTTL